MKPTASHPPLQCPEKGKTLKLTRKVTKLGRKMTNIQKTSHLWKGHLLGHLCQFPQQQHHRGKKSSLSGN